jgi:hypothetical protein
LKYAWRTRNLCMEMQSKKGKEPRRRQQGRRGCTGSCTGVMRHHSRRPNDAHAVLLHGSGAPLITSRNLLNWLIDGRRSWSFAAGEESKVFSRRRRWTGTRDELTRGEACRKCGENVEKERENQEIMQEGDEKGENKYWTGDETADAQELAIFFASVWSPMVDKLTLFSNFTIRFVVAYSSSSLHCLAGRWVVSW